MPPTKPLDNSTAEWLLLPTLAMALGWGLRGYIGGGTYGAMIPGAFIGILLCVLLRYPFRATGVACAFATVGVAFGGDMTYGQTIGLLRSNETLVWGLTGLTLKGAIWGLLGGALIGVGLVAGALKPRQIAILFAIFVLAAILGKALINEPKLIYFSDPVNKPREESWAGLLFGAVAVLGYLRTINAPVSAVANRFALWGLGAGALGFGGGSLWLAGGLRIEGMQWFPWWKFMEFSFGACLGLGYGACARGALPLLNSVPRGTYLQGDTTSISRGRTLAGGLALAAGVFALIALVALLVDQASALEPVLGPLFSFNVIGCVLMLLALRYEHLRWHVVATVPFIASVVDFQADLSPEGKIEIMWQLRLALVVAMSAAALYFVSLWRDDQRPALLRLMLMILWGYWGVGFARLLVDLYKAAIGQGQGLGAELIVHGIFLSLAVGATYYVSRLYEPKT